MEIINLKKAFGGKTIYNNYSISFKEGEINYITGPSGCGKTTLLKIIMRLEKADEGEIRGFPQRISACFQENRLIESLSALANVMLTAEDTAKSTIIGILNELGIEDCKKKCSEYSGGQKRRISIARALAHRADLYIFDEPFANLDENSAKTAMQTIAKYTKGKTVIITKH